MNERMMLDRQIRSIGFSMLDLRLYLNTHPNDMAAISLLTKYKAKYMALVTEYERLYGPYNTNFDVSGNTWQWIKDPWPWEYAAN